MRLAADIGGTKSLLALIKDGQVLKQQRYENHDWPCLETLILDFCAGSPPPEDACLAVAGPVVDNTCVLTNLDWQVSGSHISQALGGIPVKVINDFTAVGYGIPHLEAKDVHVLQPGIPIPHEPVAFLGAGTGLGEGYAIWQQDHYRVYASEGGHVDFAPRTPAEYALANYLRQQDDLKRVSVERVVSGTGIPKIYAFLALTYPQAWDPSLAGNGALIAAAAMADRDPLSVATMQLFIQAYGAEAGNVALKFLCRGGLYIAGGIAPQILPLLQNMGFLDAFADKGRMGPLLRDIPVAVILNPELGLLGAAFYPEPLN